MAKTKRRMRLTEIADAIGVTYVTISNKRRTTKDFPKIKNGNLYDSQEVCEWILTHTTNASQMYRGAETLLASLKSGKSEENPSKNGVSVKKSPKQAEKPQEIQPIEIVDTITKSANVSQEDDYTGFAQHVRWLGKAMVDTWRRYQDALAEGDEAGMQSATRTYNVQLETLRKAEGSRVELEKSLGDLVLRDVAREKFTSLCVNIKSKLMPLGAKLCHELTNQRSAKKVKEIIDSEVRDILGSIAEQPF